MDENHWSQFGDEEIILRCLEKTGIRSKTCCEFGAWDGLAYSNTAYLIRVLGWKGTFIEIDAARARKCVEAYLEFPLTTTIHSEISPRNVNRLVPKNLDFLSIDIDGNDLWVWKALRSRPGLVCIEFNDDSTARPYDAEYVRHEGDHSYGATQEALIELAEKKGYVLLESDRQCNLFFGDSMRLK